MEARTMVRAAVKVYRFKLGIGLLWMGQPHLHVLVSFNSISKEFFLASTVGLLTWIGIALWSDTKVYGYSSPLMSLKELFLGS
ncbi:hypothetical protein RJ639_046544 [Escallonia herrerae]|uniref:Uncharacterized protein n=1 Tax=Escallonia herrerae TaxID=1293975 RepID=A0AA88W5N3_9ASTE|nr:hypothetical protein RJ639_046544 [Escallonia herrerae]